jgi:hypothetical protein
MTKIIITIALFVSSLLSAQGKFEEGMGKAFLLWGEGKNTEASALFERIAAVETKSWLPNYYVALINTTTAFQTKDKTTLTALLDKAQSALDIEMAKDANNAELLVMQAMIHTALLSSDPMTYGRTIPAKVAELYAKAQVLAPENPRVVYGKAEFAIGGAKWTGADVKQLCKEVERSIGLFAIFKPETPFSPKWGLERAQEALKNCK